MVKLLFVLGAQKTGTSTMVGILNSHPDIFLMHEWFVDNKPTRHGNYAYRVYPKMKKIINQRGDHPVAYYLYKKMYNQFSKIGYNYEYFGDKWAIIGDEEKVDKRIEYFAETAIIFMIRDLRTWLCHHRIKKMFGTEDDIVTPAVDYVSYLVKSFKLNNCLHVRVEDIIDDHKAVLSNMDTFLDIGISERCDEWWRKVGNQRTGFFGRPKYIHRWWDIHKAARARPEKNHIDVVLKKHAFWKRILPIFDRYVNNINVPRGIEIINKDLELLQDIKLEFSGIGLSSCYEDIVTNKYY